MKSSESINHKIDQILQELANLKSDLSSVIDDVLFLKAEAKFIKIWQKAKNHETTTSLQTWYEVTKSLSEYFADQLEEKGRKGFSV